MKFITEIFVNKKFLSVILAVACASQFLMAGCSVMEEQNTADDADKEIEHDYQIYCLNGDGTGMASWGYDISGEHESLENVADEIFSKLINSPEAEGFISAKPDTIKNITCTVEKNIAKVNIDKYYNKLDSLSQLHLRAAIVMTLTQIEGIDYVYITVNGQQLTNSEGEAVGYLDCDSFILNDDLMPDTSVKLYTTIYLPSDKGDSLIAETSYYEYDGQKSPVMFVLDLVKTGIEKSGKLDMGQGRIVDNAYIKDGICYVDFNENINDIKHAAVEAYIILYAFVNSLSELEDVAGVQMTINGSTDELFMGDIDLNQIFRIKLEFVEKK